MVPSHHNIAFKPIDRNDFIYRYRTGPTTSAKSVIYASRTIYAK